MVETNFVALRIVKRRHARNGSHGQADKTVQNSFIAMIAGRHGMLSQQKPVKPWAWRASWMRVSWAKKASLREKCAVMWRLAQNQPFGQELEVEDPPGMVLKWFRIQDWKAPVLAEKHRRYVYSFVRTVNVQPQDLIKTTFHDSCWISGVCSFLASLSSFKVVPLISGPPEPTNLLHLCSAKKTAKGCRFGVASGGTPRPTNPGIWRWFKFQIS